MKTYKVTLTSSERGVLEVYKPPYDPNNPVIGFDESPKHLIGQTQKSAAFYEFFPQQKQKHCSIKLSLSSPPSMEVG